MSDSDDESSSPPTSTSTTPDAPTTGSAGSVGDDEIVMQGYLTKSPPLKVKHWQWLFEWGLL